MVELSLPAAEGGSPGRVFRLPGDMRLRLLATLVLAFSCALVTTPLLVPAMAGLAIAIAWAAGMSGRAMLRALRLPGLLVLGFVLLLPFAAGETVAWRAGPLALYAEGLTAAILIAGRALSIMLLVAALLGRVPLPDLIAGMRALGLPALMADIALMMHRYLAEMRGQFAAMLLAMRLRGQPWRLRLALLRGLGWTLAALLLRAHERAERIWTAMRLRGHGVVAPAAMAAPDRADIARAVLLALPGPLLLLVGRVL